MKNIFKYRRDYFITNRIKYKYSDDGKNVAFVKRTANWEDNTYRNHVWIYEKDKGKSYPLTTGDIDSIHPLWSPDSKSIAYLSSGGDGDMKNQIFVKSLDDYSEVKITDEKRESVILNGIPVKVLLYYTVKRM